MPSDLKRSRESAFWHWFEQNEARLFDFERNQETNIRELLREMHRIHRALTFEISSEKEGKREFIISADGKREAFPAVVSLADAAPELERWQVVKFRPRHLEPCTIGIGGLMLSSDDVDVTITPEGRKVGVTLYVGDEENFDERLFGHIAFLLLDHTIGEYDVETYVGTVQYKPRESVSTDKKYPLRELPDLFDKFIQSLTN